MAIRAIGIANSPDGAIADILLVCSGCEVDGAIVRHGKHGESGETRGAMTGQRRG